MNLISKLCSGVELSSADMRDLGTSGVEPKTKFPSSLIFRPDNIGESPFPTPEDRDVLLMCKQKCLSFFERKIKFDLPGILKVITGDNPNPYYKFILYACPQYVYTRDPSIIDPQDCVYMILHRSNWQRIVVVHPLDVSIISALYPYTWSDSCKRHVTFSLKPVENAPFIAQGIFDTNFKLDVNLGEPTISALKNFQDGFLFKSNFWQTCVSTILKLTVMGRHSDNLMTIATMLVDILLQWGVGIDLAQKAITYIQPYINTIVDYFKQFVAQSVTPMSAGVVKAVCAVLTCLFAVVGSFALPAQKLVDLALNRTSNLGRAISGFKTLFDVLQSVFDSVYSTVYEWIFGHPLPGDELEEFLAGVSQWFEDIAKITGLEQVDDITIDYKTCRNVERLYKQGQDYTARMSQFKLTPSQKAPFDRYWQMISKLYDRAISQGSRLSEPRTEPVIIQVFGASSVGKSGLTYLLAQDLLALEGLQEHVSEETYFRNVEQEFWDGYHGQAICVYDDFGQKRDSQAAPNPEFMEIIRTANIAPWPLHMAHLEDKARTKFTSRACILTSNQAQYDMSSLTHTTAFMRRLDLFAEVTVNPAYADALGRVDISKVSCNLDPNIYNFTLYGEDCNPLTRIVDGKEEDFVINYETFVALAQAKYNSKFLASKAKLDNLKRRAPTVKPKDNSLVLTDLIKAQNDRKDEIAANDNPFLGQVKLDSLTSNLESPDVCEKFELWNALSICAWYDAYNNIKLEKSIPFINMYNSFRDLASVSVDYDSFKYKCFTDLMSTDTNLLDEKAPGHDDAWAILENKIYSSMLRSKSKLDCFKSYLERCKQTTVSAIRSLSNLVIESDKLNLFKALGATVSFVLMVYVAKKWWSSDKSLDTLDDNIFSPESVDLDRKPKEQKKFSSESVDLERQPKLAKKFAVESVDLERQPKLKKTFTSESVDLDRQPKKNVKFASEGNTSTLSRRQKRAMFSEAAIDKNASELIATTIRSNTYMLYVKLDDDTWKARVNIVFLKGRIAVMVKHAIPYLRETFKIANSWNREGILVRLSECKIDPFVDGSGNPLDLVTITFPRQIPGHADLVKQVVKTSDLSAFSNIRGNMLSVYSATRKNVEQPGERIYTLTHLNAIDNKCYYYEGEELIVRKGYVYEGETKPGDCTSPIVASCNQLPRKIIGLHVAGCKTGQSLALAINQEMLLKHLSKIDNFEAHVSFDPQEWNVNTDAQPLLPEGGFIPVGISPQTVGSSSKTQIRESPLHNILATPKMKPAILKSFRKPDGEIVDPLMLGLKKCGINNPLIDTTLLSRCKQHVTSKLRRFSYGPKRILTHAEAIRGIEGDPWYTPMNRKSSPGFPWCNERKGTMGKARWLGKDEDYILDNQELLDVCTERLELARQGIRLPTLWTDTLKDERRPIEKVDAGKTRVFSAGAMDYVLNVRQYFMAFNAAMMENRIDNEIAVGINPFGPDWHRLALHLQKQGPSVCAGDFSNFDGSLLSVFLWAVLDIINAWYDDGEENQKIRTVLFYDIVNSIHINGNNVYQWTHSQPSGNPLTTLINCLMNSLIFRYVFVTATNLSLKDFDKYISMISYGDDQVININESIVPIFNQIIIERECKKIGFTYTDECKTNELVTVKNLSEINFLKRKFRLSSDTGFYEAPLEFDVILEMCMWVKTEIDIDSHCADNVEIAYKELSLHGREVFDKWTPIIDRLCNKLLHTPPILYSFEDYLLTTLDYF